MREVGTSVDGRSSAAATRFRWAETSGKSGGGGGSSDVWERLGFTGSGSFRSEDQFVAFGGIGDSVGEPCGRLSDVCEFVAGLNSLTFSDFKDLDAAAAIVPVLDGTVVVRG